MLLHYHPPLLHVTFIFKTKTTIQRETLERYIFCKVREVSVLSEVVEGSTTPAYLITEASATEN